MESKASTSQSVPSPVPSPNRVLKRKQVTENDIFKPCKRVKNTVNESAFAMPYQKEEQKIHDELPIRPDMLKGVIIPPKCMPAGVRSKWGGKTQAGDPGIMYRYVALHGDKARVQQNKHVSQEVREKALASFPKALPSFPKAEDKQREEKKAKAVERANFLKDIETEIAHWQREIRMEKEYNCEDKEDLRNNEFMHSCWKKLNYAARFQGGSFEHQDLEK